MLQFHVIMSLIGMLSGFIVLYGFLTTKPSGGWTMLFLAPTALTGITGFALSPFGFDPPRAVGTISLVLLIVAAAALYAFHLSGLWRWIYITTAVAALYLNVFVGVVQAFQKLPFLAFLAPTQSEPPFLITQIVLLAIFIALGFLASRRFHPELKARR